MKELTYSLKEYLATGLKPSPTIPRNQPAMLELKGAFPWSESLVISPTIATLDTSAFDCCEYPYPQVFVLRDVTLVCTKDAIYEYSRGPGTDKWLYTPPWDQWDEWQTIQPSGNYLYPVAEGLTPGALWVVADFQSCVVLTNGKQIVIREGDTYDYRVVGANELPSGTTVTAVGGQLIVGSPYTILTTPNIDQVGLTVAATLQATAELSP